MKALLLIAWLIPAWGIAQTAKESPSTGLSDLPSAEAKPKIPALDEVAPAPDLSGMAPAESPSIPQLRPPVADPAKAKDKSQGTDDSDWAAQAMLQKKEEARQRQEKEASLAEEKAREEARAELQKQKKEKEQNEKTSGQPVVAQAAVSGFSANDAQKLPAVTGLDGVKPRGMAAGDGRVQPGFDSFSGPSAHGPLGKDFQSGAKPIMPGSATADGRMQVPLQAPEPPSGGYKRISQDPNTLPAGYGEKKPAPVTLQPKLPPKSPPAGNPLTPGTPAGLSPYDNTKKVPDPRSQRRF